MFELFNIENKIIFVNSTAATSGGALSVLQDFIKLFEQCNLSNKFYIFTSVPKESLNVNNSNIILVNDIKGKKIFDRIFWDLKGMKKWSEKNNIYADVILSTQNTGFKYYNECKKMVYMHQTIPYYVEYKWSLFKKDERILWLYKNIYKKIMELTWDKNTQIIVQANWIKKRVHKYSKISDNNIKVFSIFDDKNIKEYIRNNEIKKQDKTIFFYPANYIKYKNHDLIVEVCRYINNNYKELKNKYEVWFTLDEKMIVNTELNSVLCDKEFTNIKFIGVKNKYEMMEIYSQISCLVYPSILESVGLPLLEAKTFGLPIIAIDLEYSRETLKKYNMVNFIKESDIVGWSNEFKNLIESELGCSKNEKL